MYHMSHNHNEDFDDVVRDHIHNYVLDNNNNNSLG